MPAAQVAHPRAGAGLPRALDAGRRGRAACRSRRAGTPRGSRTRPPRPSSRRGRCGCRPSSRPAGRPGRSSGDVVMSSPCRRSAAGGAGQRRAAMPRIIPWKTKPWTGQIAYQYRRPSSPTGSKIAVWRMIEPPVGRLDLELQPGPARAGSSRRDSRSSRSGSIVLDAPEVDRVAGQQVQRVAPARAACPRRRTAGRAARAAARGRCRSTSPRGRRCAGWARRPPRAARGTRATRESTRREPTAAPPNERWRGPRGERVRPAGGGELVVLVDQRARDRLAHAARPDAEERRGPRGRARRSRCAGPPPARARRGRRPASPGRARGSTGAGVSTGHRDHRPAQARAGGRTRASARRRRPGRGRRSRSTRLPSTSRSAASSRYSTTSSMAIGWVRVSHPARRDHHRQPVDQRADHLERGAAGADHDRGAQLDGGDARRGQDARRPPGGSPGGPTGRARRRARRGRRSGAPRPRARRRRSASAPVAVGRGGSPRRPPIEWTR